MGTNLLFSEIKDVITSILPVWLISSEIISLTTTCKYLYKVRKHMKAIYINQFDDKKIAIIRSGWTDMLNIHTLDGDDMIRALHYNRLNVSKWLYYNGFYPIDKKKKFLIQKAVINRNIDALEWLKRIGYKMSVADVEVSATLGYYNVVSWLCENCNYENVGYSVLYAVEKGHMDIIRYLINKDYHYHVHLCMLEAYKNNNIEIMSLLNKKWVNPNQEFTQLVRMCDLITKEV